MITKTEMSVDEALDTLTGYEEQGIDERFGHPYEVLLVRKPTTALRAIIFTLAARELQSQEVKEPQGKAYKHAMGLTVKQVGDFFPEPEEELDPEQPVTEAGKDASSDDE